MGKLVKSSRAPQWARTFFGGVTNGLGYSAVMNPADGIVSVERPNLPFTVKCLPIASKTLSVYISVRTTSWDFEGERTDVHDIWSITLAVFLRHLTPHISSAIIDVINPAVDVPYTEIYARLIVPVQSLGPIVKTNAAGVKALRHILSTMTLCGRFLARFTRWLDPKRTKRIPAIDYRSQAITVWARTVSRALPSKIADAQFNGRINPCWLFYRSMRPRISVFENMPFVVGLRKRLENGKDTHNLTLRRGEVLVSGTTTNIVSKRVQQSAMRILTQLPGEKAETRPVFVPLENYCVVLGEHHILSINADCGREMFERAREEIRGRHEREAAVLFRPAQVTLNSKINPALFELLVLDLLNRDSNVTWARKIGHTNQPEGGRDIIAEWNAPLSGASHVLIGEPPLVRHTVICQCKASATAVGKSDVRDIRDLMDHHNANGFFLATSSYLTVALIDVLLKLRSSGRYWAEWWDNTEIEKRLLQHPDLVRKFSSLVTIRDS